MSTAAGLIGGIVLTILAVAMLWFGRPRDGRTNPLIQTYHAATVYAMLFVTFLILGAALIISNVWA